MSEDSVIYFSEILKEIKDAYRLNDFTKINSELLENLNYAYNVLVFDYLNQQLNNKSNNGKDLSSNNVIDVDIAEE